MAPTTDRDGWDESFAGWMRCHALKRIENDIEHLELFSSLAAALAADLRQQLAAGSYVHASSIADGQVDDEGHTEDVAEMEFFGDEDKDSKMDD